jgi:NAD(P)-dependent dehydrogenase (short-subunit alcohol dehydrogenase family)
VSNLNKQIAIITGASRGIGKATAIELAAQGSTVVLVARSKKIIEDNAQVINENGGTAIALCADVSIYSNIENVVNSTLEQFGSIDILVNNAGVIDPISRIADSDPDQWAKAIDINLKGVYHGMRAVLPQMQRQQSGVIVNISSGAANNPLEGWSHYCASKAAAQMLTASGHKEYAQFGITVVGLSPGTVATEMMSSIKESGVNPVSQLDWSTHIPPEWPAKAVAFLCSGKGNDFSGTDFSLKTEEGRALVGLSQK